MRPQPKPRALAAIAAAIGIATAGCTRPSPHAADAERAREAMVHAWNGYLEYARGMDQLLPLSGSGRNWYGESLYMTPLDAFDTMLLMGLDEEADEAKAMVLDNLTFDRDLSVQVFEITIRHLGALNTAYQMDGDPRFLALAVDLADRLMPAFDSPTGMPFRFVNLRTGATEQPLSNPAEIGTLMIEFGTLSKLTGNDEYYDAAKHATEEVYRRRSPLGLVGTTIDVTTGEWHDTDSHISGRIDSYYEYLYKAWRLFGDEDFRVMWEASIAAVNEYLADETDTGLWYGHVDMATGERTATRFGALDAFFPAVLALSGELDRATRLMESCFTMWTTFGIEPEEIDYSTMEVVAPQYVLRPENIESAYYLLTLTGDERYRDMGRTMLDSLLQYTRVENGFAALSSVLTKEKSDQMESFFLAETLKYAYLLFAPDGTIDFDEVIFNTEAHPIWRTWESDTDS
jgi:mannosidase alpha-like ER degradation enhancer 2